MSTIYSIGAMNQLGDALENAGFSAEDVTKLKQFSNLKGIKDVLDGKSEISRPTHLIDCDADPVIPNGWSVEEHRKRGIFKITPENIFFYLSKKQKRGGIKGYELRKELEDKPVLNANVLDYLLAHPEIIPEEWKNKIVYFWGTIYRDPEGYQYVRYLRWHGCKWIWCSSWLVHSIHGVDYDKPAALAN